MAINQNGQVVLLHDKDFMSKFLKQEKERLIKNCNKKG